MLIVMVFEKVDCHRMGEGLDTAYETIKKNPEWLKSETGIFS